MATKKTAKKADELRGFIQLGKHLGAVQRRVFLNISGRPKCGKTSFLATLPRPLAIYNIDNSLSGPLDKYADDPDIFVNTLRYDPMEPDDCLDAWEEFVDSFSSVMKGDKFRSVAVDTGDELLQMQRIGAFGDRKAMALEYQRPNSEFRNLWRLYHDSDKILVVTHKMSKQYVGKGHDSKWNGEYEPKGFSEMPYLAEVNIELYRYQETDGSEDFGLEIKDCRVGVGQKELGGEVINGADDVNFQTLMSLVYPDSSGEEWE